MLNITNESWYVLQVETMHLSNFRPHKKDV